MRSVTREVTDQWFYIITELSYLSVIIRYLLRKYDLQHPNSRQTITYANYDPIPRLIICAT